MKTGLLQRPCTPQGLGAPEHESKNKPRNLGIPKESRIFAADLDHYTKLLPTKFVIDKQNKL